MPFRLVILSALSCCILFLSASAQDRPLRKTDLPKAVIDAFEKNYAAVKEPNFAEKIRDKKAFFQATYNDNGKKFQVLYAGDGTLIEKEEQVAMTDVPQAAIDAIKKDYPKADIRNADKVMKPDGGVIGYDVDITDGMDRWELLIDASGKNLRKSKD
jgi:hypothetical protein